MRITIWIAFDKRNPRVEQQVVKFLKDEFGAKLKRSSSLLEPGGRNFELVIDPHEFLRRYSILKGAKADGNKPKK